MELKYLEWNLHSMGAKEYQIPLFICDYLNEIDIFVLVEFCIGKGWDTFKKY